jgi:hypothetical protein
VFGKGFWGVYFILFYFILNNNKKWLMWYKVDKNFKFFIWKSEKFCLVFDFFIYFLWIVIKSYWCNIKSKKKVEMFREN